MRGEHSVELERLVHSTDIEELRAAARDRRMTQDLALVLLERREIDGSVLDELSKNAAVMKHRKVIIALVAHPRTPKYVSLPIARRLYTFELMKMAITPSVPADVKMMAEESVIARLQTISSGERLTLAKQGSTRIAAALLRDIEPRVRDAALVNYRMTEAAIVQALMREDVRPELVEAVCVHPKWCMRREVQVALLRQEHTPLTKAVQFAERLPLGTLRDVLKTSRLTVNVRSYLERIVKE